MSWPQCPQCKVSHPDYNCQCPHPYHTGPRCASCHPTTCGAGTGHPLCVGLNGNGCEFWKKVTTDHLVEPEQLKVIHGMGCSKGKCIYGDTWV